MGTMELAWALDDLKGRSPIPLLLSTGGGVTAADRHRADGKRCTYS
jgi:hypothetical protein